jgi:hypothetical protein
MLMCVLLTFQCASAQTFKKNATAGFAFLEVPVTARTAALGEASLALSESNSSAVFENPAALGFTTRGHSLSVSYAPWFADIKNYAASYALKTEYGVFALGLVVFDYGSMPRSVVAQGQKVYEVIGTFEAKSLAFGLTYSKTLTDRFSFGATVKYAQESIDSYRASNLLLDGGVLYRTGLGSFRIAASIQNFGVNAKFINDEFKMPSVFKLGAAVEVVGNEDSDNRITLLAGALHPNDAAEKVNVGGEYSWRNSLSLRAGYKFFSDEESYSVGVGLNPQLSVPFSLDFAYSDYGRLGRILRFTLHIGLD